MLRFVCWEVSGHGWAQEVLVHLFWRSQNGDRIVFQRWGPRLRRTRTARSTNIPNCLVGSSAVGGCCCSSFDTPRRALLSTVKICWYWLSDMVITLQAWVQNADRWIAMLGKAERFRRINQTTVFCWAGIQSAYWVKIGLFSDQRSKVQSELINSQKKKQGAKSSVARFLINRKSNRNPWWLTEQILNHEFL